MKQSRTYKGLSNDLALLLGLPDALEAAEEELGAINYRKVDSEMLLKSLLHLLTLVETHQAYTKLVSVRLAHKTWSYRCR
jgi:hypothetical protein